MATEFETLTDASAFRRMAASMWRNPRDPTIYGSMDLDVTATLEQLQAWRVRPEHFGHEEAAAEAPLTEAA